MEVYGEGRWHQVPIRAGLNRCRKSCRLRWLNYLKPSIKRGEFSDDEVDLIIRLHKLLGNRWSLIAGRLPGRTANDVKNYWNTHQKKKTAPPPFPCKPAYLSDGRQPAAGAKNKNNNNISRLQITKANIIKPRPRTFSSKSLSWPMKPIEPNNPATPNKPNNNIINLHHKLPENHDGGGGAEITRMDRLERFLDDGINNLPVAADHEADRFPLGQLMSSILPEHQEKSVDNMMMFEEDSYQSFWSDLDICHLLSDRHDI
ncbi:unnamed protein product [Linum tenue]|uniref:Uncharacterized protein n=1 Tax=Linum tenue TaxID=586396 RepID=A0AAV0MZ05_9ROSI|nr:unnamed protein product [Linum tenue]